MKKKSFISILICLAVSILPITAQAASSGSTIDLSDNVTASGDGWTYSAGVFSVTGDVTITGKTTGNRVVVASGANANITLKDASIDVLACAFDMKGATVNLMLTGSNTLKSGNGAGAGLNVPDGSSLTIGGAGSLTATGDGYGAGIGGSFGGSGGTIVINSGSITATGGSMSAGIGGAYWGGSGGTITINGGTVTATGGGGMSGSAGIGGGYGGSGGTITINGGAVTANGNISGAGVGGGGFSPGGTITISGGAVTANGGNFGGAGIGGAYSGASGDIAISGNAVIVATGGNNDYTGGGAGIGSGYSGTVNSISINTTGTVTATGGTGGGTGASQRNGVAIGAGGTDGGPGAPTLPTAPQNVQATPTGNSGEVKLSWTAPTPVNGIAITGYEVSSDNENTWAAASSNTEHTFSGLTGGIEYKFSVRSLFNYGYGMDAAAFSQVTGIAAMQSKTLQAWIKDGTLHVSGLTVGKEWSVYNLAGTLLYQKVADANVETWNAASLTKGIYIVASGAERAKVN